MRLNYAYVLLLIALLISGCASSQEQSAIPDEYSNLVELTPPADTLETVKSTIYVDSVKVLKQNDQPSLLIMGAFPDGCTNIGKVIHKTGSEGIKLTLESWRDPKMMCTQALVSFSFIYRDIPEEALKNTTTIQINETNYSVNQ